MTVFNFLGDVSGNKELFLRPIGTISYRKQLIGIDTVSMLYRYTDDGESHKKRTMTIPEPKLFDSHFYTSKQKT